MSGAATISVIFHHPLPIKDVPQTGSETHPTRMLESFRALGYEVDVVAGHSGDRRKAMKRVLARIRDGHRYDFVYARAATSPTILSDPHHLPFHPLADWRFLAKVHATGTPIGLFYPDVYWRFPYYDALTTPWRARLGRLSYRYDLWWYRRVLDRMFVPSLLMSEHVPGWAGDDRVVAMAPGGATNHLAVPGIAGLKLFYVGAISSDIYDISPLLDAVGGLEGVTLTICCPSAHRDRLPADLASNISVVHLTGEAVRDQYCKADISCLVFSEDDYRRFSMPVKLFESIGYGRPVLASAGNAVGEFVAAHGLGWSVPNDDLRATLERLRDDPEEVERLVAEVRASGPAHSWLERARFVADELTALEGGASASR